MMSPRFPRDDEEDWGDAPRGAEMTEAERWSGSRILFDRWCPRGTGYFVAPMPTPLGMWFGAGYGRSAPFVVLHPHADPSPVMAAHVAEAYRPDGLGEIVGGWS